MQEDMRGGTLSPGVANDITQSFQCARAGNERGFDVLVQRLSPLIAGSLRRLLGGDSDAASAAVQDAWLAAWQEFDRFCSEEHLLRWLHRVAKCRAISGLRKRHGAITTAWHERAEDETGPLLPATDEGGRTDDELTEVMRTAIASLPDTYRGIATLHFVHGQRVRDVALLLGLRISTVKMRLYRARLRLRRSLRGVEPH